MYRLCFLGLLSLIPALGAQVPVGAVSATIRHVIDGDTVITTAGEHVRLLDINTPEQARRQRPAQPWAVEAKGLTEAYLSGQTVWLVQGRQQRDRHGRLLAHVYRQQDNWWANGALVEAGLAHVYTFPDNAMMAPALQRRAALAMVMRRGIWSAGGPKLTEDSWKKADLGRFAVVDGRVVSSQRVRDTIYLNFGADWRTDFTVAIERKHWDRFKQAGIDARTAYRGRRVRVRGVAMPVNGVLVNATHPEQIEILQ